MKRYAILELGKVYKNKGGGEFFCLRCFNDPNDYILSNVKSGWTFMAHVITMYEDGTIEWDYSDRGYFMEEV